jgi:predicted ATPase
VENEADQAVVTASEVVSAALRGVFHLDPIPHLMRSYVPQRDSDLRRTGENLSAAVARLRRRDRATFHEIVSLLRQVADERIQDIEITRSDFGDVMLGLREGPKEVTPAREMSDGLLRFIAVATALLTSNQGLDIDPGVGSLETEVDPGVLVVIEEIENGLHPSQAGQILRLINETVAALDTQVLVTTHSPALLNEMPGEQLTSVLVCYRDHRGRSAIDRLPNLPGYERAMAAGALGDVVTRGELIAPEQAEPEYQGLRQLLGLE